jgi:hypothetical protein
MTPFEASANLTMGRIVDRGSRGVAHEGDLLVRQLRLDAMISAECLPDPDLMKVDVEGAEAAVLDGAVEVLRRARPVLVIELHATNQAVAERLERMAFIGRLFGISDPIRHGPPNATLVAVPEERGSALTQLSTIGST